MAGEIQAMAQGLSQKLPLSAMGLAGPGPTAQNPRGGMPGGFDPMDSAFNAVEKMLDQCAANLEKEGRPKSLRMANELKAMSVKVNRFRLEHSEDIAQQGPQGSGGGAAFPSVNGGGLL